MLWSKVTMRSGVRVWINLNHCQVIEEPSSDTTNDISITIGLLGGIKMHILETPEEIFANAIEVKSKSVNGQG